MSSDDLAALAADAYIYGFPLVFDLHEVGRCAHEGMAALTPAGFNAFSHATSLAGPEDKFVSVNNDTIYSIAQIDVSGGPLVLSVPDARGRYYVLQFVDAWTNNFAYVGRRGTGTQAGRFLLVPPGWKHGGDDGAQVIEFPTDVGTIVGRWACDGHAELQQIRALQAATTLEPYPAGGLAPGEPVAAGVPAPTAGTGDLLFFERLRTWMAAFPPSDTDRAYQQRFAPLGLLEATSPYPSCPPDLAGALSAGASAAKQTIEATLHAGAGLPEVNGWRLTAHMFDYNTDHLGLGTIDDLAWKISDRQAAYRARAIAARGALWGNHGYEAAYPMTYVDGDGHQLDGRNRYTVRFEQSPPVDAFWSITMYDVPEFHLVANPIGRYSIGDRTPGLRHGDDGSLTIEIQHERPADSSNWLPAPAAPFRPVLRLYQPSAEVLDGSYQIPPISRVG